MIVAYSTEDVGPKALGSTSSDSTGVVSWMQISAWK